MIQRTVESNRNDVAILREMEFDLVSDMSFVQQRQSRGFFEKNTLTKNNSDQKPQRGKITFSKTIPKIL